MFPEQHRRVTSEPTELHVPAFRTIRVSEERAYRWRRLYQATVLRLARRSRDRQFLQALWRESLGTRSYLRSTIASLPLVYRLYRRLVLVQNGPNRPLHELLARERIDAVLHPTVLEGPFVSDLIQWRESTGKPLVFLMNSWDNPSTKAMTRGADAWLVAWGEQSKRHAIEHLGWRPERIRCFGAAQFEVYKKPPRRSRTQFLTSLGLQPEALTLLYAGSSKGLNEVEHLLELERAASDGRLPECQIVFRPHPWRGVVAGEPDFFSIPWRRVVMDPQMADYYRASRSDSRLIFTPDYEHTHTLLSAIDAMVSPISTILLEAAMHGKPILGYLPEEEIGQKSFIRTMANMRFMREFYDRVDCGPVTSRDAFVPACRDLLEKVGAPGTAARMREQTRYFVATSGRPYGELVAALLEEIL